MLKRAVNLIYIGVARINSLGCIILSLQKIKLCVKIIQIIGVIFLASESCVHRVCLTKRAPDAGDSAAISSSFLRLSIFLAGRLRRPRPSAGNANRWAVPCIIKTERQTQ